MKYTIGILAWFGSSCAEPLLNREVRQTGASNNERRYTQLTDMMNHYNPNFDARRYWTYGCHCFILGDSPMSGQGHGKPVDVLDVVCKRYKDCQRCARERHGALCFDEFVRYKYDEANDEKFCKDKPGTCDRALCECDLAFAKAHVEVSSVFTTDYHQFWSTQPNGWQPEEDCLQGGHIPYIPMCCGKPDSAYTLYNAQIKNCCDGVVKNDTC